MFGNGITVVDVIFAPIMQRIRIAKQIRGLDVPEEYAVRVGVVFQQHPSVLGKARTPCDFLVYCRLSFRYACGRRMPRHRYS